MKKDKDFFQKLGFEIITIDVGPHVYCDACNEEYTESEDKGGIQFVSQAICPKCTPDWEKSAYRHGETHYIRDRAHPNESFKEFVYRIRKKEGDNDD